MPVLLTLQSIPSISETFCDCNIYIYFFFIFTYLFNYSCSDMYSAVIFSGKILLFMNLLKLY